MAKRLTVKQKYTHEVTAHQATRLLLAVETKQRIAAEASVEELTAELARYREIVILHPHEDPKTIEIRVRISRYVLKNIQNFDGFIAHESQNIIKRLITFVYAKKT